MRLKTSARARRDIVSEIQYLESLSARTTPECRRLYHLRKVIELRNRRAALIDLLGGRCEVCARSDTRQLQFDHYPETSPHDLSAMSQFKRMDHYEECAARGGIRLLCATCNATHGGYVGALRRGLVKDTNQDTPLLRAV
jgi:hypothetical protein